MESTLKIKAPKNSGSLFFNYKEFYSIVLLAIVDAEYTFVAVDTSSYGREGDAGIYLKITFGQNIQNNKFPLPPSTAPLATNDKVSHVIVGDEAYALHENLMKPYPKCQSLIDPSKAIYNYRLSRPKFAYSSPPIM